MSNPIPKEIPMLFIAVILSMSLKAQVHGYIHYGTLVEQQHMRDAYIPDSLITDTAIIKFRADWKRCCGWRDSIHLFNSNFDIYPWQFGYASELLQNLNEMDKYDSLYECTIRCHYNIDSARHYTVMRTFYFLESEYYWALEYGVDDLKKHLTTKGAPDAPTPLKSKCDCETNQTY